LTLIRKRVTPLVDKNRQNKTDTKKRGGFLQMALFNWKVPESIFVKRNVIFGQNYRLLIQLLVSAKQSNAALFSTTYLAQFDWVQK
jgi:hypothetical protein